MSQEVSYLWRKLYANRNAIVIRQFHRLYWTWLLLRDNHQQIDEQRVINRNVTAYLDWTSRRCIHGDE